MNCLHCALHVYENSLPPEYYFINKDSNLYKEADVQIYFENFENKTDGGPSKSAVPRIICDEDNEISAEIWLNINYNFMCKHWDDHLDKKFGVNLFTVALREIGHKLGLEDNDDPTSIMFRHEDNFHYIRTTRCIFR